MDALPSDVLLIDKPIGCTSFDVIRRLQQAARDATHLLYDTVAPHADERGRVKMGHAGTLDPLASGLMLIGIGPGTKALNDLTKLDKVYEAVICVGEQSASGDAEGPIVARVAAHCDEEAVTVAVSALVGTNRLRVPALSAVKRGGESLYKKVRRGEDVEAPLRDMTVYDAELLGVRYANERTYVHVRLHVASGVYIRSLAEALGKQLGYPARLEELRRTRVGPHCVEDAVGELGDRN